MLNLWISFCFPVCISNGAFIHWSFSIISCPLPTCLSVSFFKLNSSIQALTKGGGKIPGTDTLTKIWDCSAQGLHDNRLVLLASFWVIWRVSWYGVKVGLYFFIHFSSGWVVWCPLRDVVCHGLTVSWLGRKEKKTNRALPKPAILCPCRVCGRACTEQRVCTRYAQASCTKMEEKQEGMPYATLVVTPLWGQMGLWGL